ncbi:MAG: hypothetical protein QM653_10990 [Dysgonomonas sp.]|uniref:hypothetical protein n=1 Tax=Dysgonomonas sp. TaxID=1891233 RepID=UPI0039E4F2A4
MNHKILHKINIIICFSEVIIGLLLLVMEVSDFIRLPSVDDYTYGLELVKYKEYTYSRMIMYGMMVFAGISFFYNKRLYSLFTISFILSIYLKYQVDFYLTISGNNPITVYSLPILTTFICFVFVIKLYKNKSFIGITISRKIISSSILIGLIWFIFYTSVEYFGLFDTIDYMPTISLVSSDMVFDGLKGFLSIPKAFFK